MTYELGNTGTINSISLIRQRYRFGLGANADRAGIEATFSQVMRMTGLRQTRYIGLNKTHLHNILSASALNLIRVDDQ